MTTANPIITLALKNYRESLRTKRFSGLLIAAAIIIGLSAFFGSVTIGDQVKVIKDAGLFSISILSVAYLLITGPELLQGKRGKALSSAQFLGARYLGALMTAATLLGLMAIGFIVFVWIFERRVDLALFQAYLHIFFELLLMGAVVMFFAVIAVTPILVVLFSAAIFCAGRSVDMLQYFFQDGSPSGVASCAARLFYWILPHLSLLNVNDRVVYGESIPIAQLFWTAGYAVGYAGILLLIAHAIFSRRERGS